MRLVVTGGAGFIGSNFIRYWIGRHPTDSIVNLDLLTYAGDRSSLEDVERDASDRYTFVHGDIADPRVVSDVISTQVDVLVNFAAESHNSRAVLDPARAIRTNVVGTQVLLEAARQRRVGRFHHVSTCEVYGDLPLDSTERFSETSSYRPRTPYNASKAGADHMVRAYHETFGLDVTISNCSNNYGPYQHPEKVIPRFIASAFSDRPLPIYRSSEHRREWLFVDDHCRAIEAVIERGRSGETYNVGSGEERTLEQLADELLEVLERPLSLKSYVEDRPGHDRRYLLDHTKIERELAWSPAVVFSEGLRRTVAWYRGNERWWRTKFERTSSEVDETAWSVRAAAVGTGTRESRA